MHKVYCLIWSSLILCDVKWYNVILLTMCHVWYRGIPRFPSSYHWAIFNISGDRAPIPCQSRKCPQKHGDLWRVLRHNLPIFMANTTGQIVLTWKKPIRNPPYFINLLSFLLDWIWKYRCTARTGKDFYYLVFIDHLSLHVYPLLWIFVLTCTKTMLMRGL